MRIEIRARNTAVTDGAQAPRRGALREVAKQVSELAQLEVELLEERNPDRRRQDRRGDSPASRAPPCARGRAPPTWCTRSTWSPTSSRAR